MKKLIFNDRYGITKAVLEGRKTMTRRIVSFKWPDEICLVGKDEKGHILLENRNYETFAQSQYAIGEVVAVAQSYIDAKVWSAPEFPRSAWENKMFVKAELMPHQIRITNINVERLQDISDQNCIREGIQGYTCVLHEYQGNCYSFDGDKSRMGTYQTPRSAFAALIDKVSGNGTWERNPWCFCYEFELVKMMKV